MMKEQLDQPYSDEHQDWRRMDWFIPGQPSGRALLGIHGGGWSGGSKEQWHSVCRHFAEQGYVCASAEYRLAPHGDFHDQVADLRLAMATFRSRAAELGFRSDRIAALGSSAGGHLVAMLATIADDDPLGKPDELPLASTRPDFSLCYCPVLLVYNRGLTQGFGGESAQKLLRTTVDKDPELFRTASPIDRITGDEPPFLFVHGDADTTVPLRQSTEMHRLLLEAGVDSRLVVLPEVGHGFGYGVESPAQQLGLQHIELALDTRWGE